MYVCIFEDSKYSHLLPLVYFRPVYELRCGVLSLRAKLESLFPGTRVVLHVRGDLADCVREQNPGILVNEFPDDHAWFINGRILTDNRLTNFFRKRTSRSTVFVRGKDVAAVYVDRSDLHKVTGELAAGPFEPGLVDHFPHEECSSDLLMHPWDFIQRTAEEIEKDVRTKLIKKRRGTVKSLPGSHLVNRKNIIVGNGTVIKPGAVLDAAKGSIVIGKNVTIMPNAFIEGPAYIGDHTIIKAGARIYHGTSVGEHCKVGGEVDASIIQSYSNKQHDGFLGHSYISSWVNIGADTNTSDLKNTYGTIKVSNGKSLIDTRLQFMGLLMGDHSKTGINVMFDTGSVVGVSCNIFGAGLPPKFLPSFAWGSGGEQFITFILEKSLETARRVMERRSVVLSPAYEKLLRNVFAVTEADRQRHKISATNGNS